jgi:hypothetical protein
MARLRKAGGAAEQPVLLSATTRGPRRSSPRKANHEPSSKHELRYTLQENEDSFLIPKVPTSTGNTPRKQRVLRPVASNSRLLRKLSNESLATPETKAKSAIGERGAGTSYAKSLARTLAKRSAVKTREHKKMEVTVQEQAAVVEIPLEENEDVDQSLWCGDADEPVPEEKGEAETEEDEESEDEDEDPVVDVKNRRRQVQVRTNQTNNRIRFDKENKNVLRERESHHEQFKAQRSLPEATNEMLPPVKMTRSSQRIGQNTISKWAQDVIDLTSSPEAPHSLIVPMLSPPSKLGALEIMSRPTSSSSNDVSAILQ